MKKNKTQRFRADFFALIILAAVTVTAMTACSTFFRIFSDDSINIRTEYNLNTVVAGGTLRFRSGTGVIWYVSSTSDGSGPVAYGTSIDANGVLLVSPDETVPVIYIIARTPNGDKTEFKPIRVVTVSHIIVSPEGQSVAIGRTQQFSAAVTGNNNPDNAVTWKVSSNPMGTGAITAGTAIDPNGLLRIAANETVPTLFVTAISVLDPSKSGSTTVNVVVPTVTRVTVSSENQTVRAGSAEQFTASVMGTNDPDTTVTWRVSSNSAGTGAVTPGTAVNADGILTIAPNETVSTLYVTATSAMDSSKSGSASVRIIRPTVTGVSVSPANQTVETGSAFRFSAVVTGTNDPDTSVTWKVSSNAAGTGSVTRGTSMDENGVLSVAAAETAQTLFVFAVSAFDPSKSGSVTVTVRKVTASVTSVTVSPSGRTINAGSTLQFTATVTGTNNPNNAVTWKVSSNAAGTGTVTAGTAIDANGLLSVSANETVTTLHVLATSMADTSKTGSVTVNVTLQRPARPPATPATPVTPATPTVTNVTVSPAGQSVTAGRTLQFSATVTGTNNPDTSVTWIVSSNAAGTGAVTTGTSISARGLLTVATAETITALYIFAVSNADTSKSGSVTVNVVPVQSSRPPSTPAPSPSAPATPAPAPATPATPAPSPSAPAPSPARPATPAPATPATPAPSPSTPAPSPARPATPAPATPATPAPATPTVTGVTISPATASIQTNRTMQFSATVTGTNNPGTGVTWRVSPNPDGTGSMAPGTGINANGLLTVAPNEYSPTLYITATSTADPSKRATSTVTVTNANPNQGPNQGQARGRN